MATENVTDIPQIDFITQARDQLIGQYQQSPNMLKLIDEVFMPQMIEVQQMFFDLLNLRQLDVAVGDQLDIIGRIVGQDRYLVPLEATDFFGFTDVPSYIGFFDTDGGVWQNTPSESFVPISDDLYRRLINAKIYKNQMDFTLPEIEILAQIAMDDPGANATVPQPLLTRVCFSKILTPTEKYLLNQVFVSETNKQIIPPPAGCNIEYCEFDGQEFGFLDMGFVGFYDTDGGTWGTPI